MYKSTRGLEGIHASKAIIDGIASDGGLYVTDIDFSYSQKDFDRLKKLSYKDLAVEILEKFLDDFTKEEITDIVYKNHTGAVILNTCFMPSSFLIRSLNVLDEYTSPSLSKNVLPHTSFWSARNTACTTSCT